MQLPRGTFREIQKNKKAHEILADLDNSRFSGVCSISSKENVCTLVLKSGKCILAEYKGLKGNGALQEFLNSTSDEKVDTALSTLTDAQIQLSLEFNKAEHVSQSPHIRHDAQKPESAKNLSETPSHRIIVKKATPSTPNHPQPPGEDIATLVTQASGSKNGKHLLKNQETIPAHHEQPVSKTEPEHEEKEKECSGLEKDLELLDSMNLDKVTDKIREDCKTMVKQLRLDHLMDKD